ncbi:hypothetical protein L210DRAFT_3639824 [Boletus edulis BED1]|uniref:F-box domain-containing protein n=1 Tax=Boletus edulis BED1 TaxID=1328754 RepID=A0AAD4C7N2_BOLED|nr:hypothetical protein L210DRAFT_3639824 [Boletus edulis BED1]
MSLPVELVLAIADLVPLASLPALARASSGFCHIAQSVLYRHVSASHNLAIVPLLARKPHIARHVRSFYIALDALAPLFSRFYSVLARALQNMSDLHSLHLLVDANLSWILRDPCVYPNLVHFTCTFSFDDNVACFLQQTPSLLELEVDSIPTLLPPSSPLPDLPTTSIPHLQQFIGSSRAAALLVPGRPVNSIHLNDSTLTDDVVPLLARSTGPVLVLGAVTNASPVPLLQLLHRHLPHLAYLRVMSTQNLFQPPSPEFYEQVANVLTSFPELNAFELSGMHWGSQRKADDDSKRVWQSSPLSNPTFPSDEHVLFGTDIFLAY